jgi:glycosyltransferase involved in cell wall biosynthesis
MHLAFLTNEYPPLPSGGIGTSVQNLARALVATGHRVTVLGWAGPHRFEDHGVQVHMLAPTRLPKIGWLLNRLRAQREINRLVREAQLALVEAPDWCAPSAGMRLRCPLVLRCHGSATYFADIEGGRVRRRVRFAEGRALAGADAVGAVSEYAAERTRRLFGLRGSIRVVPNGIDLLRFPSVPAGVPAPGAGHVLYFGTLIRKKGVFDLGEILRHALAQGAGAPLELVGRDSADARTGAPSTYALLQQACAEPVRARMAWRGPRPPADMPAIIAQAAACLLPSYAEACPVSWLEAMACARPIVGYDFGWARELLGDSAAQPPGCASTERCGFLVPPGDTAAAGAALALLLRDPALAAACGARARERVEVCFSIERAVQLSLNWYRAAGAGSGERGAGS